MLVEEKRTFSSKVYLYAVILIYIDICLTGLNEISYMPSLEGSVLQVNLTFIDFPNLFRFSPFLFFTL